MERIAMKLYRFENDFGCISGIYVGYVMATNEVEARELFIMQMNKEHTLELRLENYSKITPTHVSNCPDCFIEYIDYC